MGVAEEPQLPLALAEAQPPLGERVTEPRGEAEAEGQPLSLTLPRTGVPEPLRDAAPGEPLGGASLGLGVALAEGQALPPPLRLGVRLCSGEAEALPQPDAVREALAQGEGEGLRAALREAEPLRDGEGLAEGEPEGRGDDEGELLAVAKGLALLGRRTAATPSSVGATANVRGRVRSAEKGSSAVPVGLSR